MRTPPDLDDRLHGLNGDIAGWHEDGHGPRRPVLLVVGAPRSGTTVTYQLLARSGAFAYPSNLVARFYRSPAFGARVQAMLAGSLPTPEPDLDSDAGNTRGWWGPHEFSFFWRHHLGFGETHADYAVSAGLAPALGAFEREAGQPLLLKSNLIGFAVGALREALPTARFVHVVRDPVDTVLSILRVRERGAGLDSWWSTRVPGPVPADPIAQAVHQVRACRTALTGVPVLRYEALAADVHGALGPFCPVDRLPRTLTVHRADDPRRAAVERAWAAP